MMTEAVYIRPFGIAHTSVQPEKPRHYCPHPDRVQMRNILHASTHMSYTSVTLCNTRRKDVMDNAFVVSATECVLYIMFKNESKCFGHETCIGILYRVAAPHVCHTYTDFSLETSMLGLQYTH
jgi:hypothetical protein